MKWLCTVEHKISFCTIKPEVYKHNYHNDWYKKFDYYVEDKNISTSETNDKNDKL